MKRWPAWMASVFTMELRKILSYRADFWMQFFGSLLAQFGVAWFLWRAIFAVRGVSAVGGWSFRALMLYYVVAPLMRRTVEGSEFGAVSQDIYEGSLNRYLVYPVSFFRYRLAAHAANSLAFLVQLLLAAGLFAACVGIPAPFRVSWTGLLGALAAAAVASYLYFVVVSTIELTAFWADNVWSLVVTLRFATGLLGGAMIPLAMFPGWAQGALKALPFAYFVSFPVTTALGRTSAADWLVGMVIMVGWSVAVTLLYRLVWERGQYRYTGVGI